MFSVVAAAWSGFIFQTLEVAGALGVLTAFVATQLGVLDVRSRLFLLLNFAGSTLLAVLAGIAGQYGFLMLEGVWALVSAWGLSGVGRGRVTARAGSSSDATWFSAKSRARWARRR